jgi:hypothetical protein
MMPEQVMLSDDLRKKREAQLFTKEKYLRDQQRNRFGFEGDLFKKRQELIKPVRTRFTTLFKKLPQQEAMILSLIKVKELPLSLPTQNWTKAMMCSGN